MITHSESAGKYLLNKKDVGGFLQQKYGIVATSIVELKGGMINTSLKISTAERSYLLRVYRRGVRMRQDIERELNFCESLARKGVPVARTTPNHAKNRISVFTDKAGNRYFTVLFQFLRGSHTGPLQHQLISDIARLHAAMHRLGERHAGNSSSIGSIIDWLNSEHAVAQAKLASGQRKLAEQLEALRVEILDQYLSNKADITRLPFALSHLDYDSSNILNDGRSVTGVIDFDDLSVVPAVLDLGFSLWWWCYFNDSTKNSVLRGYIKSYEAVRRLTREEKKLLPFFVRVRNLILLNLLFVNAPRTVSTASLRKGIALDAWFKQIDL